MIAYHEVDRTVLDSILQEGLKRTSRGAKGQDTGIAKTDAFLDERRPMDLRQTGVSRDDNVYAFLTDGGKITEITEGKTVRLDEFIQASDMAVLRLTLDPERCYVSDLDSYDKVRESVEQTGSAPEELVDRYWSSLVPLGNYKTGSFRRPEIMVPYDIAPGDIEAVK